MSKQRKRSGGEAAERAGGHTAGMEVSDLSRQEGSIPRCTTTGKTVGSANRNAMRNLLPRCFGQAMRRLSEGTRNEGKEKGFSGEPEQPGKAVVGRAQFATRLATVLGSKKSAHAATPSTGAPATRRQTAVIKRHTTGTGCVYVNTVIARPCSMYRVVGTKPPRLASR
jgi:hypothetical protein